MQHRLLILALALTALPATAQAEGQGRRARAQELPPEIAYRDAQPRFRAPPPFVTDTVRAYVPRPTNQPMFNEPPQPLR